MPHPRDYVLRRVIGVSGDPRWTTRVCLVLECGHTLPCPDAAVDRFLACLIEGGCQMPCHACAETPVNPR